MVESGVDVKGRVVGFPELRSKVVSKKSVWNKLVSAVTFGLCI